MTRAAVVGVGTDRTLLTRWAADHGHEVISWCNTPREALQVQALGVVDVIVVKRLDELLSAGIVAVDCWVDPRGPAADPSQHRPRRLRPQWTNLDPRTR